MTIDEVKNNAFLADDMYLYGRQMSRICCQNVIRRFLKALQSVFQK